jgi:tetratricopeptide (TPR) repeat protein
MSSASFCSDSELDRATQAMEASSEEGLRQTDLLIAQYPNDARLHFLKGSMLVTLGRPIEAHASLCLAVHLAPDFPLARFQLGLFELTSGEAEQALRSWEPLSALADDHYLKIFVTGLSHLIRDEFSECVVWLRKGITRNQENQPLNRDMQMVIDQCTPLIPTQTAPVMADERSSETSFLLRQLSNRGSGRLN